MFFCAIYFYIKPENREWAYDSYHDYVFVLCKGVCIALITIESSYFSMFLSCENRRSPLHCLSTTKVCSQITEMLGRPDLQVH